MASQPGMRVKSMTLFTIVSAQGCSVFDQISKGNLYGSLSFISSTMSDVYSDVIHCYQFKMILEDSVSEPNRGTACGDLHLCSTSHTNYMMSSRTAS